MHSWWKKSVAMHKGRELADPIWLLSHSPNQPLAEGGDYLKLRDLEPCLNALKSFLPTSLQGTQPESTKVDKEWPIWKYRSFPTYVNITLMKWRMGGFKGNSDMVLVIQTEDLHRCQKKSWIFHIFIALFYRDVIKKPNALHVPLSPYILKRCNSIT